MFHVWFIEYVFIHTICHHVLLVRRVYTGSLSPRGGIILITVATREKFTRSHFHMPQ